MGQIASQNTNILNFAIVTVEECLHITLTGKLLHDYSKKIRMTLLYIVNKGVDKIIIDASKVSSIDHSNSSFLIKLSETLSKSDRKMSIIYPIEQSCRVLFDKLKISDYIKCVGTIHEAISYFDQKHIKEIKDVVSSIYKNMNIILSTDGENSYSSVVINKYDTTLWFAWPKNKEMNLITVGDTISCMFLKCDGIFQFTAPIYKKILNPNPTLVVMKPSSVTQAEIRNFYRYDTRMVMQYKKFYDDRPPDDAMTVSVCTNLSAGGIQIESNTPLEKYDYIIIYLQLPGFVLNNMIGKIVRVIRLDSGKFSFGVKFTSIFEIDRLKIENYILEKMNLRGEQ